MILAAGKIWPPYSIESRHHGMFLERWNNHKKSFQYFPILRFTNSKQRSFWPLWPWRPKGRYRPNSECQLIIIWWKNYENSNFPYLAFAVTFKIFFGLLKFFWHIWCLRSPMICKNPISKHSFIPNSKWIKFPISVHYDICRYIYSSKNHRENKISCIFLQSPHQVDTKNVVKYILWYSTTLYKYTVSSVFDLSTSFNTIKVFSAHCTALAIISDCNRHQIFHIFCNCNQYCSGPSEPGGQSPPPRPPTQFWQKYKKKTMYSSFSI